MTPEKFKLIYAASFWWVYSEYTVKPGAQNSKKCDYISGWDEFPTFTFFMAPLTLTYGPRNYLVWLYAACILIHKNRFSGHLNISASWTTKKKKKKRISCPMGSQPETLTRTLFSWGTLVNYGYLQEGDLVMRLNTLTLVQVSFLSLKNVSFLKFVKFSLFYLMFYLTSVNHNGDLMCKTIA